MSNTFYWHDYETFGISPARDRPAQFAGLRTDENLNVIGEPLVIYCQPVEDILPTPEACLVTGITPQKAQADGLPERQFIEAIHAELAQPGTCGVGYNSIRFDDEVTRYTLYRNFYDPYEREWKNGNSRWDIIDMLRLTRALRPEGIEWPDHEPGVPSFRLEDLTAANGLSHESAHDALSDVQATIALAKLVKEKQPQLFDYVYRNRGKRQVQPFLDLRRRKPFFHVSGMLPRERLYSALMMPLAEHPTNSNAVICVDLSADPQSLLDLDAERVRELVFTAGSDLPDGLARIPLKAVHTNKAPVVATPKLLDHSAAKRLGIDLDACEKHWQRLREVDLQSKLQQVFADQQFARPSEAEQQLYDGFLGNNDKYLLRDVRSGSVEDFSGGKFYFSDPRYNQLLLSYRARNFQQTLSGEEMQQWRESCLWRLTDEQSGYLSMSRFKLRITELQQTEMASTKQAVLSELKAWGEKVAGEFGLEV